MLVGVAYLINAEVFGVAFPMVFLIMIVALLA